MKPNVKIRDLSFEYASELAELIPEYQRDISVNNHQKLVRDMELGQWSVSPDALTVVVDAKGLPVELANGQHRVLARLDARIPKSGNVPVIVLTKQKDGLVDSSYLVTDQGRPRLFADSLKAHGVMYYNELGTATRWLYDSKNHPDESLRGTLSRISGNSAAYATPTDLMNEWRSLDEELAYECVRLSAHFAKETKFGVKSAVTAFAYKSASELGWDEVQSFLNRAAEGSDPRGSAARELRETAIRWRSNSSRTVTPMAVRVNTLVLAWHKDRAGEEVKSLRWSKKHGRTPLEVVPDWMRGYDLPAAA